MTNQDNGPWLIVQGLTRSTKAHTVVITGTGIGGAVTGSARAVSWRDTAFVPDNTRTSEVFLYEVISLNGVIAGRWTIKSLDEDGRATTVQTPALSNGVSSTFTLTNDPEVSVFFSVVSTDPRVDETITNLIKIGANFDNELLLIATTGETSTTIFHGACWILEVSLVPQQLLPHGGYTLTMICLNWGGPYSGSVTLTRGTTSKTYSSKGDSSDKQVAWTEDVVINV